MSLSGSTGPVLVINAMFTEIKHIYVNVNYCAFYSPEDRLGDATIRLTDYIRLHPTIDELNLLTLCGTISHTPGDLETVRCQSNPTGRYLYIYHSEKEEFLTLCEVRVYGERK